MPLFYDNSEFFPSTDRFKNSLSFSFAILSFFFFSQRSNSYQWNLRFMPSILSSNWCGVEVEIHRRKCQFIYLNFSRSESKFFSTFFIEYSHLSILLTSELKSKFRSNVQQSALHIIMFNFFIIFFSN